MTHVRKQEKKITYEPDKQAFIFVTLLLITFLNVLDTSTRVLGTYKFVTRGLSVMKKTHERIFGK